MLSGNKEINKKLTEYLRSIEESRAPLVVLSL
jgi:hypothetical protein